MDTETSVTTVDLMQKAKELGRGLMRGDDAELKSGYSARNATSSVCEAYGLSRHDRMELETYLRGFAIGLNRGSYAFLAETLRNGFQDGWLEDPQRTLPADPD